MSMTMHTFRSLQSDASLVAKESRLDLLAAAVQCWQEYPLEKMESVWLCLYSSFHGVQESGDETNESYNSFTTLRWKRVIAAAGDHAA